MSLDSFLRLAILRSVFTAIKAALREKHEPLNRSIRSAYDSEDIERPILDLIPSGVDVHDQLVTRLELRELLDALPRLTDLEERAIVGLALGYSYAEIEGGASGRDAKKVDNAVQRARRKLRAAA